MTVPPSPMPFVTALLASLAACGSPIPGAAAAAAVAAAGGGDCVGGAA
ncbi:MAG: hypothetical protein JSR73_08270 [Proteobacteria bacterium]|nr:hypothetical protein [Pseudomonadota bacterium]